MNCLRLIWSNICALSFLYRKVIVFCILSFFFSKNLFSQTTIGLTVPANPTTVCQSTVIGITGTSNDPNALFVKWVRVTNGITTATGPVVATTPDGFGNFTYSFNFNAAVVSGLQTTHVFRMVFGPTADDVDFETIPPAFETLNNLTITVNPNPTATLTALSGINSVCQNAASPTVNITGVIGTAPFTYTYRITDPLGNVGSNQTVVSNGAGLAQLTVPTNGTIGTYTYQLLQIQDASSTACSNASTATLTMTIVPLPTATITASSLTACVNTTAPVVTITGAGGTAPFTFTYREITDGTPGLNQVVVSDLAGVATFSATITSAATRVYELVSVQESSATACANTQTSSVTIVTNANPNVVGVSPALPAICFGAPNFSVTFSGVTGAPDQYRIVWNNAALTAGFTNDGFQTYNTGTNTIIVDVPGTVTPSTTYSGTLRLANSSTGCFLENGSSVTINPLPTATITRSTEAVCVNGTIPTVTITATGATAPYSVTYRVINNGVAGGNQVIVTNGAGEATINVPVTSAATLTYELISVQESSATNCVNAQTASTTITVNALPDVTVTVTGSNTFCAGGSATLSVPNVIGSLYSWTGGGTSFDRVVTTSGGYAVTITNTAGCTATSGVTNITVNTLPTATITPTGPTTFCAGGSVSLNANAGAGLNYVWSNASTAASISNITTGGTYTVTVTDGNNCSATSAPTTITVNALPTATITPTGPTTFCAGGSVTLNANVGAGLNYVWSNASTAASISNITTAGTYTVTVTDGNNCSATSAPTTIVVNALPTAMITPTGPTTFCAGGSVSLNANTGAGLNYVWSNASTGSSISNITTGGTYTVTVTDGNNCSTTSAPTTITVNTLPAATITPTGPTTFCSGASVTLNANTGAGLSYVWSNASTASSISNITTGGTYTVTVTDGNNCSATSSPTTVTVNALPTATITPTGPTTFCAGGSVTLNANTGAGLNYVWSNASTASSISNITTAGTYIVTVTDGNNCSATSAPTTIVVNALPTATITPTGPTTFCAGGSVTLNANAGAGLSYVWSNASTASSINNITTSGTYTVTVTDGNNCSATSAPRIITVNALPTANITASGPLTFCAGNAINLTASNAVSYLWSNGVTTNTISNITNSGSFSVTITDANGCSNTSAPVTVTVNALPSLNITNPAAVCSPGTVNLTAATITAGSSAGVQLSYWTNATATLPLSAPSVVGTSGTYYIRAVETINNCSVIRPVTVSILPQASMVVNTPTAVCAPNTIDITTASITNGSTTGLTYTYFSDALGTIALNNPNAIAQSGTYYIKGTPAAGCSAVVPVQVTINPLPVLVVNNPAAVCAPSLIDLTRADITSGSDNDLRFNYFIDAALAAEIGNPAQINSSGTYYIRATKNTTGCQSSLPVTVTVNPVPSGQLQIPAVNFICENSSLTLTASGSTNYQWLRNGQTIPGANAATYAATVAGTYTVRFTSAQGCNRQAPENIVLEILSQPVVDFAVSNACVGVSTSFQNRSQTNNSGGINWLWEFGDGSSSNQFSTQYAYLTPGVYQVKLTASNPNCSVSASKTMEYIVRSAARPLRYADVETLRGMAVTVNARNNIGNQYQWSPVTGVSQPTIASPIITVNETTLYTVAITSDIGCITTDTVLIKVIPGTDIFVPQGFTPNNDGQNDRLFPILVGMRQLNYFKVFNRWGNMIFSTNSAVASDGWNGVYLGAVQPTGVYTWIAEAIDLQGRVVRRTGTVMLLR